MHLYSYQLTIHCRYHHPFKDQLEYIAEGSDLWGLNFSEFLRLLPVVPNEAAETGVLT